MQESTYKKYVAHIFIYILIYPQLIKIGGGHMGVFFININQYSQAHKLKSNC